MRKKDLFGGDPGKREAFIRFVQQRLVDSERTCKETLRQTWALIHFVICMNGLKAVARDRQKDVPLEQLQERLRASQASWPVFAFPLCMGICLVLEDVVNEEIF